MTQALVIVDIQNDYFPGGAMPLEGSPEAAANAAKLLAAFRAKGLPVVHVQHISTRPGATFFLPDTKGAEINDAVTPQAGEKKIVKHTPSSFRGTDLQEHLKSVGADQLVIAGMMTHMCIDSTVRAAFDLGYACTLAHDACATRNLVLNGKTIPAAQVHESFLAGINGLFAKLATADEIVAGL
ncbi:cysteine hydrolase [Burkholderiaceae bacterium FT117]|uniref:cysteine hydrolase family protein n=1 Tax=Zeimonas sediminis TaxID=2944268 RepID=UPI002342C722|nr:cysteine hydrolase family protein [Zeimonas sediminis]MCM5570703.1 cysteine hydrolase [Zeimonas sediminis]